MTEQEESEIFEKAVHHYTTDFNINMVSEEVGELLQAINKLRRVSCTPEYMLTPPNSNTTLKRSKAYYALCSEIADVKIVLEIFERMLSPEAVKIAYERKIDRLKTRMEAGNNATI